MELQAIQKLRFEVFNLELGEGLDESYETGIDHDRFDPVCHHLMVTDRDTTEVVGTYRMQTGEMADRYEGFYSADEFELASLPPELLADSIEIGRACVARESRNRQVLFLLWKGLAAYLSHNRKRYLFGCCSLTSQDPAEGKRVLEYLRAEGQVHPDYHVAACRGWECVPPADELAAGCKPEPVKLPKLFKLYLRYGAKVCGEPALDPFFKTIDYLALFDLHELDAISRRTFFK